MANPPEAPTVAGLLHDTIRTFRRSWRMIVPVCALLSVPYFAVQTGLASYLAHGLDFESAEARAAVTSLSAVGRDVLAHGSPDPEKVAALRAAHEAFEHAHPNEAAVFRSAALHVVGELAQLLLFGVILPLAIAAVAMLLTSAGHAASWHGVWRRLGRLVGPVLAVTIPVGIVQVLVSYLSPLLGAVLMLPLVLPLAAIAGASMAILVGTLLGPAVLNLVVQCAVLFVAPAIVIEGRRGRDAVRRSRQLFRGDWKRALVFMIAVTAAFRWGPQFVSLLLVLVPAIVAGQPSWVWYVWSAVHALVLFPLMVTAYVLLYLDVRRRLEHAGVEPIDVAGALEPRPA